MEAELYRSALEKRDKKEKIKISDKEMKAVLQTAKRDSMRGRN